MERSSSSLCFWVSSCISCSLKAARTSPSSVSSASTVSCIAALFSSDSFSCNKDHHKTLETPPQGFHHTRFNYIHNSNLYNLCGNSQLQLRTFLLQKGQATTSLKQLHRGLSAAVEKPPEQVSEGLSSTTLRKFYLLTLFLMVLEGW